MELQLRKEYGKLDDYIYDKKELFKNKVKSPIPKRKGDSLAPDELPSATNDVVFKHMFACEEGKLFACMLIESIFDVDLDELQSKMVLYRNEVNRIWPDGKSEKLDFVGLCDDVFFSIEMNNTNKLERNADYANRLYARFAKEGDAKGKYVTVGQINLNNFTIPSIDKPINISRVIDKEGRTRLRIIYIDIYLPHIVAKYKRREEMNRCEKVTSVFFATSIKKAKEISEGEENMIKYLERLIGIKAIKEKMEHYYDMANARSEGREEGESIGFERGETFGMEKGLEKTATKMLEKGLDPQLVQECTKLPWEKIEHLISLL